jgi:hypothetical protein
MTIRKEEQARQTARLYHAQRRLRERFNIDMTLDELEELYLNVHKYPQLPKTSTNYRFLFRKDIVGVYSKRQKVICTFFPYNSDKENESIGS